MAAQHEKSDAKSPQAPARRKRKTAPMVVGVVAGCLAVIAAGFGLTMIQGTPSEAFGLGSKTQAVDTQVAVLDTSALSEETQKSADLSQAATRDISVSVQEIRDEEEAARIAAEEAQRAAEEALRAEEERVMANVYQKMAEQEASVGIPGLSEVDWSVGKVEFIATWTARIDAYLAGSPLAGQGVTFATAAWECCVDPRWSPAISMTESTKGLNCFRSHNAWGWGNSSWGSWEEAINAHVAGLSDRYGYTISRYYAKLYCPPSWENWYSVTLSQMELI